MQSLLFALNAVAPIVLMVAIGYFLKRYGFMTESFAKTANKLVFRVFLPCMLFLNVYKIQDLGGMDFSYVVYVLLATVFIFLLAIPATLSVPKIRGDVVRCCRASFAPIMPSSGSRWHSLCLVMMV